jgi:hypothetical protein
MPVAKQCPRMRYSLKTYCAWMDRRQLFEMSKSMWERFPAAHCNSSSMLILDTFHGYLYEKLKVKLEGKNCVLVVIPSGMTSQLIPLDVLISNFRMEYKAWLLSDNLPLTPYSKIEWASASELSEWVLATWKKIPRKIVEQSFKKFCITNALMPQNMISYGEIWVMTVFI